MRVADAPERPLFVWDGDCRFCGWWVRRWMSRIPEGEARAAPYREVTDRFPEIPESSFRRSAKLVLPDGRVLEAAASVFRLLAVGGRSWPWRLYRRLPPVRWATEAVYRLIGKFKALAGAIHRRRQ
ncbi:MAG: thiol-disulfide oxidoreductase DCC family protein, partial [Gemmatimonadota bacterium]